MPNIELNFEIKTQLIGRWALDVGRFFGTLKMITKIKDFLGEVKVELQKASWPWDPKEKGFRRYKELSDSTVVVVISMILLGGCVAFFDFALVNFVHFFTRLH